MKTETIVTEIIKEQSQIVGEYLAKNIASNSGVVKFNSSNINDISLLEPETTTTIKKLIASYQGLFGKASVEVCMNVLKKYGGEELSSLDLSQLAQK